jgi:hypothetical protein
VRILDADPATPFHLRGFETPQSFTEPRCRVVC